ncbi:MAG TPA: hypothetical protein PLL77_08710 [Pyrinomonadaceae bacterium]|nr:hypothetical protein [Pyrinomonadaceae bacterium]
MKEKYIHILGIAIVALGLGFVVFLYWSQPKTLAEVATKSQVVLGTYEINRDEFTRGLALFRSEDFIGARAAFDRADPEKRDANTQFYTAYSYYRQGWGRLSKDDTLFKPGLEAVDRVMILDPNFRSTDETLTMKTPSELKYELEEGLKLTPDDFNPMKLTRERK